MDISFEVSDPTDWLQTSLRQVAPVEAALRCQVCKDFFDTPMITSCSHTFCSLCIRRCLTNDGKCPTCRAADQELRLRRNWTVEEVVQTFKEARPALLQLNESLAAAKEEANVSIGKRKREEVGDQDTTADEAHRSTKRKTRSQSRIDSDSQAAIRVSVADSEADDEDYQPDDGLTACPICSKRMKEAEVFAHLDVHNEPQPSTNRQRSGSRGTPIEVSSRSRPPPKSMDRLPQISYGLMKDNALKKKLAELGIPNGGPRPLLIKRHTEWVNLVNSNCDSSRPRTKRELLSELDTWERSQGRNILNGLGGNETNSVMRKDFDSAAWASSHSSDFQHLIAKARQRAKAKSAEETQVNGENDENNGNGPVAEQTRSPHFEAKESPTPTQNGGAVHPTAPNSSDMEDPPRSYSNKLLEETAPPQRTNVEGVIDLSNG